MPKQVNIEALHQVIRVLRALPDVERLVLADWTGPLASIPYTRPITALPCGTAACAIGWCGLDPWFTSRGFGLEATGRIAVPTWGRYADFAAIGQFFAIPYRDARRLFAANEDDATGAAARDCIIERIEEYIAQHTGSVGGAA